MLKYQVLNVFFFVFHTAIILFNLFGWLWKSTRKWNLLTLTATGFSWFGLGIWYGWGYCPCTDWHWQVRLALGYRDMPYSYVKFLVDKLTGLNVNAALVDTLTVVSYFVALGASIWVNRRWFTQLYDRIVFR